MKKESVGRERRDIRLAGVVAVLTMVAWGCATGAARGRSGSRLSDASGRTHGGSAQCDDQQGRGLVRGQSPPPAHAARLCAAYAQGRRSALAPEWRGIRGKLPAVGGGRKFLRRSRGTALDPTAVSGERPDAVSENPAATKRGAGCASEQAFDSQSRLRRPVGPRSVFCRVRRLWRGVESLRAWRGNADRSGQSRGVTAYSIFGDYADLRE